MIRRRLLLVTDAVGGVWTYSLELARALQPIGVDTILCVAGPAPSSGQRESAGAIRLIEPGLPLEWLATTPQELRRAGKELARIATSEGADVVQTNSGAFLAGAAFEQPTVAVQHSCVATWWAAVKETPPPPESQWSRDLLAEGLAQADAVAAPTAAFAKATAEAYDLGQPLLSVHNGRALPTNRALPQGDFVLTAGRLWDDGKNATTLDRAAARIDVPFQAAGPIHGPNGTSIALNHMTALDELDESRLAGLMGARPIFASAAQYEPFGLSVLEAALCGCALVLSDIPTHRELWDGAALFTESRNDVSFGEAISTLLRDREKRNLLGESARRRALRYTPEAMARRMAGIYASLVEPQLMAGAA